MMTAQQLREAGGVLKAIASNGVPSVKQVADAARVVAGTATRVAQGKSIHAPAQVIAARWAICSDCPLLLPSGKCDRAQGGCNCYMPAKHKLAASFCPLRKWAAV